jgi:hypothetical protein
MTQQATTPFVETSQGLMLGFGAPISNTYDVTALTATGTITLTPTTPGTPFTRGRLRIKSSLVNAATTLAIGIITGTDGTNTVTLRGAPLATTAVGVNFDLNIELVSDLQLTSISFTVTLAGSTQVATINSELFANP